MEPEIQAVEAEAPVVVEAEAVDTDQVTEPVGTVEDSAREQGWRPKEEWTGDPSKWVSAETFVAKGELIAKIESLGRKLKDTEKTMAMFKDHHAKVKETEFKNAVAFLKQQKKEAYESGDVDKIIEIDDRIADVRETQKKQQEAIKQEAASNPDFDEWVSENNWYNKDTEMRTDADTVGAAYKRNNPEKSAQEILDYVTKKIKQMHPDKFQNQARNKPSAVEGSTGRQAASRDAFLLSDEEKKVMNTFIRQGIMTKDEYIAEIKKVRGAA